jgi:high-affinity iron transporter
MFATAIIVFREVLEASLVIGIVLAASRGVPRRGLWVTGGAAAGVFGAGLVAAGADAIAAAVSGVGQELFNASILFAAVAMLGWHNIWMNRHGRELASASARLGASVSSGSRPLYALALVVGIAVLREGSEIVLFLYGIAAAGGASTVSMLIGGVLGLAGGVAVSALMYFGLLAIPAHRLFAVTSGLITLLAAGLAAQAVVFLQQAGYIDALTRTVWNTSNILSQDSLFGRLMHTLIGYSDKPNGAQLVAYIAVVVVIVALMKIMQTSHEKARLAKRAVPAE